MPAKQPLLLSLLFIAPWAQAQDARIVPADPLQFEHVSLRQTVDDCAFDPERVRVTLQDSVIHVEQPPKQCFAPGNPAVVDIQLGAFPVGEYTVELHNGGDGAADKPLRFVVGGLVQPAVFPPPAVPLENYSGIWWNASESGWGLSLHQGRLDALVGSIYVFDEGRDPVWYTLGAGRWETSTRWTGEVFHSQGPSWSATSFDRTQVKHEGVGTVTIDFGMKPGTEDSAKLEFSLSGVQVHKTITRLRF